MLGEGIILKRPFDFFTKCLSFSVSLQIIQFSKSVELFEGITAWLGTELMIYENKLTKVRIVCLRLVWIQDLQACERTQVF
jgi:hypothetical protein